MTDDLDGPTEKWAAPRPRPEPPPLRHFVGDLPAPHLSRERWARIVIDRPGPEIEPRPAATGSYRPDTIFDGWSTDDFTLRLASVRGRRHRGQGTPRQDDVAATVHPRTGSIVFAVADGASAAEHSHIGAALACRSAIVGAMADLERRTAVDWQAVFQRTAANLVSRTGRMLGGDGSDVARAAAALGTTLVAGVLSPMPGPPKLSLGYVGGSAAWLLKRHRYERLTPRPAEGALPLPHMPDRVGRLDRSIPADAVLLVGTAGFGDPLGEGRGHVGELFAWLFGMSPNALALAHVLDFVQEAYDDDRTLLAVSPNRARTREVDPQRRSPGWSAWQRG
ncbi:MAG TPA: protein phosphatase 2C domain-containing protein [Micromonosporaceae bacterium]|nr:protein phosphatase 2C domain-containing protein [Micromonosporaceae bacterium]